jgi:hypothetical protein
MHISLDSELGRQRRLNQIGETINSIAAPAAAYSLRSLTGGDPLAVRVRRDTGGGAGDDDEKDFTVSEVASGALLDWVGSGNDGFVHTWYDQSGNDRDSIQDTDPRQPIIVESGTFQNGLKFTHADTTNGKRMYVPRNSTELGTEFALTWVGTYSGSVAKTKVALGNARGVQTNNTGAIGIMIRPSANTFRFINENLSNNTLNKTNTTTVAADTTAVAFANFDDDAVTISVNGNAQTSTFSGTNLTSTADLRIMTGQSASGATGGTYRTEESLEGICKEILVYDTNQSNNRTSIETNIINHYSIS